MRLALPTIAHAASTEAGSGDDHKSGTMPLHPEMAAAGDNTHRTGDPSKVPAGNVEMVMRIPVTVQAVLGTAVMPVAQLVKLGRGAVIGLDRRVGEPVDIVVNGQTIARGEIVVLDENGSRFGISLTEVLARAARTTPSNS